MPYETSTVPMLQSPPTVLRSNAVRFTAPCGSSTATRSPLSVRCSSTENSSPGTVLSDTVAPTVGRVCAYMYHLEPTMASREKRPLSPNAT